MGKNDEEIAEADLKILEKIPKRDLKDFYAQYVSHVELESYAKFSFIILPVMILIHNIFIAGNSYTYDTYDNILLVEISIVVIVLIIMIGLFVVSYTKKSKLEKDLENVTANYPVNTATFEKVFSAVAIHYYGGRGIQIKDKND